MKVNITGVIKTVDNDLQIVGDTNTVGILDLLNDIELAIDVDRTLGGKVIHAKINSVDLGKIEYPNRFAVVQLDILFEQTKSVRA